MSAVKPKIDFSRKTPHEVASKTSTTIAKYAGELISVSVEADLNFKEKIGIDAVIDALKTKQITTVVKSKYDWEEDKRKQGDAFELAQHRKDGFLEKSAFLARVEDTQFERERIDRLSKNGKSSLQLHDQHK